jgi:hypothetical protein
MKPKYNDGQRLHPYCSKSKSWLILVLFVSPDIRKGCAQNVNLSLTQQLQALSINPSLIYQPQAQPPNILLALGSLCEVCDHK